MLSEKRTEELAKKNFFIRVLFAKIKDCHDCLVVDFTTSSLPFRKYQYDNQEDDSGYEQNYPALVAAWLLGFELILVPDSLLLHLLGNVMQILMILVVLLVVFFHIISEGLRSGRQCET
jgi:hypothetical protein